MPMEGVFSPEFIEKFEQFKTKHQLPGFVWEKLEDTIGWVANFMDENLKDLEHLGNNLYLWNKPPQFKCPACCVLFKIDEENKNVHILSFYDTEKEVPMPWASISDEDILEILDNGFEEE